MQYENAAGYPEFEEFMPNGTRRLYLHGYPSVMLDLAIHRDDPVGYRFYFDRHFTLDAMTIGGSIVLIAANKGAVNVTRELIAMGAKDSAYDADELIARAEKVKAEKERIAAGRLAA